MKTTLKLIIALMLAGAGIGQAWAKLRENPIGHITYSRGADDHGELRFFNDQDLTKQLTTGTALDANGLEAEKDGEGHVVGYRVYVCAEPDLGYTVKDMTLQAELTTNAMQAHRRLHGGDATFDAGQTLTLTPVEDMPYVYTMVMPDDPNLSVSVTATFAEKAKNTAAINYIDADGTTKTKAIGSVYVLDGTEEYLGEYYKSDDTWYVCNSTLDFKHHIYLWSCVHLILADGAKMSVTVTEKNKAAIKNDYELSIYDQSTGDNMGSLTATGVSAGIGGNGSVTINGGEVTATGYNGIEAPNVTINGGKVTATATGENGYGIYGSDITLGWNSATGSTNATNYGIYGTGSVKTTDGKMLKYTDGNSQTVKLMGTLDADAIAAIAGKELTPYGYGGYCGKDNTETTGVDESKNVTWEIPLVNGALSNTLTISGTGDMADYKNDDTSEEGNFAPWLKPNADGDASDGLKYESVTVVNITDGVTSVSHKAFDGCSGLKLILVPNEEAYDAYYNGSGWGTYKAKLAPQTMTVAKNASGWGTYCHRFPVSYSLSEGATAYTVSGLSQDGKSVSMAQAADNHVTPETPLLLNYTAPDEDTETDDENVTLTAVPATATTVSGDDIVSHEGTGWSFYGNAGNAAKQANTLDIYAYGNNDGKQSYILFSGDFIVVDEVSFITAHRCWLNVTTSGSDAPKMLSIGDDDGNATGIATTNVTNVANADDAWYSLDGRRINGKPAKGIYIKGGRKVVIK